MSWMNSSSEILVWSLSNRTEETVLRCYRCCVVQLLSSPLEIPRREALLREFSKSHHLRTFGITHSLKNSGLGNRIYDWLPGWLKWIFRLKLAGTCLKGGTNFLCPTRHLWLVEWALVVILSQIAVVQEWADGRCNYWQLKWRFKPCTHWSHPTSSVIAELR